MRFDCGTNAPSFDQTYVFIFFAAQIKQNRNRDFFNRMTSWIALMSGQVSLNSGLLVSGQARNLQTRIDWCRVTPLLPGTTIE